MGNFMIFLTAAFFSVGLLAEAGPLLPLSRFTGRFQLVSSQNFDEYMQAVGVGWMLATLASAATPITEISEVDGLWDIKTSTTFKTTDIQFRLGDAFDEETADGRHCRSVVTHVEDSLVHKQVCNEIDYEIVRRFVKNGDEMVMTLTAPGPVESVRLYKRI